MKQALTMVLALVLGSAAFADPAGVYAITMETRQGMQTLELVIEATERGYSGALNGGRGGDRVIESIDVEGDRFEFPLKVETPMGELNLTYSGTVAGDDVTGNIETPMGTRPFSGSRK